MSITVTFHEDHNTDEIKKKYQNKNLSKSFKLYHVVGNTFEITSNDPKDFYVAGMIGFSLENERRAAAGA